MEKHPYAFLLILSLILSLGIVSFVCCVMAESKKAKEEDLRLDNKLCYLPQSPALGFAIAAIVCLAVAQLMGNLVICSNFFSENQSTNSSKARKPVVAKILLALSWMGFVVAVVLLSGSASMSRAQPYGRGWLEQECYIVKDGVFTSAGVLAFLTLAALLGSAVLFTIRKTKGDEGRKIHAQAQLLG